MNEELSHCCKAPKEVSHSDEGTACYLCSDCKQEFLTQEQCEAIPPTDGEIVATDAYIQGQIDAYEWVLANIDCEEVWICRDRIAKLKGE